MKQLWAGLGVSAAFAALTALFVWLQGGLGAVSTSKPFTHLHCPECGLEVRFEPARQGAACPQCGAAGPKLVATVGPYRTLRADTGPLGKMLVGGLIALVLTAGLAYAWILYSRARGRVAEAARKKTVLCHCPFCRRKLGFPSCRIGDGVTCPRCKTAFVLPEGELIEESLPT